MQEQGRLNTTGVKKGQPEPLIEVHDLSKGFGDVKAVDEVSFQVFPGEAFGVVGESGSGKSTLGRLLLGLLKPTAGTVVFQGKQVGSLVGDALKQFRRRAQIVFQNPYSSLNPRHSVETIVSRPMKIHRIDDLGPIRDRVRQLLSLVGLSDDYLTRYPNALSGGERQRVAIARALALEPLFVVFDEPTSALDVSVQAQIVDLLLNLQRELGLTYIFISHDLGLVDFICDRTLVMYRGRVVELGRSSRIHRQPYHPYTRRLISSILTPQPVPDRQGDAAVPVRWNPPPDWRRKAATLIEVEPDHYVAAHDG